MEMGGWVQVGKQIGKRSQNSPILVVVLMVVVRHCKIGGSSCAVAERRCRHDMMSSTDILGWYTMCILCV